MSDRPADPLLVEFRALRNMLGIRADTLAKAAGVDKSSLSYWECGRHSPHLDKFRAICTAAGFDIALVAADEGSEAAEVLTTRIGLATAARDEALAERDRMVEVLGRVMSLPPEKVAYAYGVGYTGDLDKLTTTEEPS
ncbi:MAG TPA: helix-turn-helix transcriptional regulator [Pseudonocardia sp.]